ncbi:unnamed protein product, partial [Gongylonema pulchrum]|uniref:PDZ domain-containing protein n=1 Tax=Gongylonema pulchrum TaxID=637853 RepID=A0A183DXW5_9BILA
MIYYHIDDETVPYCTDVMVPPDKITLGDFKRVLTRSNFKYYCKAPAPDSGVFPEVKVEIRDDNERLHRSTNGQFELFLLTSEGSSHSDGSSGLPLKSARMMVPGPAPAVYPIGSMAYRQAVQQFDHSMASTDSDSLISDMRALPMQVKGMSRRPYQQQYLVSQGSAVVHSLIYLPEIISDLLDCLSEFPMFLRCPTALEDMASILRFSDIKDVQLIESFINENIEFTLEIAAKQEDFGDFSKNRESAQIAFCSFLRRKTHFAQRNPLRIEGPKTGLSALALTNSKVPQRRDGVTVLYQSSFSSYRHRHLIGFSRRSSHLSLSSELSSNASYYLIGHRGGRRYEDSTLGSESDARLFSDDDDRSRVSTSTDITSVSRQHHAPAYRKRRNRRRFRQPSRASSFSSITESSMSLDVITVTLNMDTVNFLGISIVGQSSSRGDNGIYVANIMKGGAVALDGRIEPGDMILQVNDISFENFTNDQAVDVLRES